jgi:hypothetical protein
VHLRLHSRRIMLDLPAGVERLRVELPGGDGQEHVVLGGIAAGGLGEELEVGPGRARVELELVRRDRLEARDVPPPAWSPWPLARRFAGEGRDRLGPLLRRVRRTGSAHSGRRS